MRIKLFESFDNSDAIDLDKVDNLRFITNKFGLNFVTGTIGPGFYLSIYFEIPVPNSVRTGENKKFILKDLV
jgi:hypothetical protein